jgi:hypothetical protein
LGFRDIFVYIKELSFSENKDQIKGHENNRTLVLDKNAPLF